MTAFAQLPSVDRLLAHDALAPLIERHGRAVVTTVIRDVLAQARAAMRDGALAPKLGTLLSATVETVAAQTRRRLRAVFNLTGTVLHTNLGRATLPDEARPLPGNPAQDTVNPS